MILRGNHGILAHRVAWWWVAWRSGRSIWSTIARVSSRTTPRALLIPFNLPLWLKLGLAIGLLKIIHVDCTLFADVLEYLLLTIWGGDREPTIATRAANEDRRWTWHTQHNVMHSFWYKSIFTPPDDKCSMCQLGYLGICGRQWSLVGPEVQFHLCSTPNRLFRLMQYALSGTLSANCGVCR